MKYKFILILCFAFFNNQLFSMQLNRNIEELDLDSLMELRNNLYKNPEVSTIDEISNGELCFFVLDLKLL